MPTHAVDAAGGATLGDYRWLVSPAAEPWLQLAAQSSEQLTTLAARLRRECTSPQTHLVLQLVELRRKARAKFSLAERMFFTPVGLEQATDQWVAEYKARRFAGATIVSDLCCGVGGDLLALSRHGKVTGIDRDPAMAVVAEGNAAVHGLGGINVRGSARTVSLVATDVRDADLSAASAWHIDPDRRPTGRRTTHVELHEPDLESISLLLASNANAAIKLSPATEVPPAWTLHAEQEWISRDRQCRQLVAWFGGLARSPGLRRATVLDPVGQPRRTIVGQPDVAPPTALRPGGYLFEPDPAVLAARLDGALAAEHALAAVAEGVAYYTGDRVINDAALAGFEVREVMPFRPKTLKAWLRRAGIGRLEIKTRGVEIDPAELRRRLEPRGDDAACVLLARIDGRVTAMITRRVDSAVDCTTDRE